MLADVVSLVRFATHQEHELHPFATDVNTRFDKWMAEQKSSGAKFTEEQERWLRDIRDQIATSLTIEIDDFDEVPFNQRGGLGKAYQLFGDKLQPILNELNEVLVA